MSSNLVAAAKLSFIDIGHNGAAMGKDAVFPSCEPGSMTSSIANCVRGAWGLALDGTGPTDVRFARSRYFIAPEQTTSRDGQIAGPGRAADKFAAHLAAFRQAGG